MLIDDGLDLALHHRLVAAADRITARPHDYAVPTFREGYLLGWMVDCAEWQTKVVVHRLVHAPVADVEHDHEWDSASVILRGRYIEHTKEGSFTRTERQMIFRRDYEPHRLELFPAESCTTLFLYDAHAIRLKTGDLSLLERIAQL